MFGALGMLLSSTIKQLENFAGIMNFVIFPMFFASSRALPAVEDAGRAASGSITSASTTRSPGRSN